MKLTYLIQFSCISFYHERIQCNAMDNIINLWDDTTISESKPMNQKNSIYMAKPKVAWVKQLCSGKLHDCGMRYGNGVVVHDSKVFVTTDEGQLVILDQEKGNKLAIFTPESRGDEWYTLCQSSVAVSPLGYVVYAVIDVPSDSNMNIRSRIFAVLPNGDEYWSSSIFGVVSGTPVVGSKYIYVSHTNNDNGLFTALRDLSGNVDYSEGVGKPSGPLTLRKIDGNDTIFWGESTDQGYTNSSILHKMTVVGRKFFKEEIQSGDWATVTSPTVDKAGEKIWMSTTWSRIYGMFKVEDNYRKRTRTNMDQSHRNDTMPLLSKATLSNNERFLYSSSTSTSFYCIEAETGDEVWKTNGTTVYMTEARISDDDSMVYTITHDGTVHQYESKTGVKNWEWNCTDVSQNPICYDSVEADFALDGHYLYYADIFGKVIALQVASFTKAPTPIPTHTPSMAPSLITKKPKNKVPKQQRRNNRNKNKQNKNNNNEKKKNQNNQNTSNNKNKNQNSDNDNNNKQKNKN